jgi:hypothetical protein
MKNLNGSMRKVHKAQRCRRLFALLILFIPRSRYGKRLRSDDDYASRARNYHHVGREWYGRFRRRRPTSDKHKCRVGLPEMLRHRDNHTRTRLGSAPAVAVRRRRIEIDRVLRLQ